MDTVTAEQQQDATPAPAQPAPPFAPAQWTMDARALADALRAVRPAAERWRDGGQYVALTSGDGLVTVAAWGKPREVNPIIAEASVSATVSLPGSVKLPLVVLRAVVARAPGYVHLTTYRGSDGAYWCGIKADRFAARILSRPDDGARPSMEDRAATMQVILERETVAAITQHCLPCTHRQDSWQDDHWTQVVQVTLLPDEMLLGACDGYRAVRVRRPYAAGQRVPTAPMTLWVYPASWRLVAPHQRSAVLLCVYGDPAQDSTVRMEAENMDSHTRVAWLASQHTMPQLESIKLGAPALRVELAANVLAEGMRLVLPAARNDERYVRCAITATGLRLLYRSEWMWAETFVPAAVHGLDGASPDTAEMLIDAAFAHGSVRALGQRPVQLLYRAPNAAYTVETTDRGDKVWHLIMPAHAGFGPSKDTRWLEEVLP